MAFMQTATIQTKTDSTENSLAISVRGLKKNYGALEAVKGIDIEISQCEIFGLIGPDGAGKTSTFQILGGVMQPTEGEALMFGETARDARSFVGYLTQAFSLYQDLSVRENLQYMGELRLLSDKEIEERGMRYLKMFDMDRFTNRLAGRLSGGMKQKLALACALIAEPRILLLDEPTTGVDPVSRREFWDALVQLSQEGMTIVVATPYLDEAERCTRVALMYEGLIHQAGTPAELRKNLGLERIEVRTNDLSKAENVLSAIKEIHDVQRFGDRLDVMVKDAKRGQQITGEVLEQNKIEITEIQTAAPMLENTFVALLRELGGELTNPPFPRRREFRERPADAIAIGAYDLQKTFGDSKAVSHINIEVKYGEIYGLLGANGAGKTTTIKMLCGLLAPSGGEVELACALCILCGIGLGMMIATFTKTQQQAQLMGFFTNPPMAILSGATTPIEAMPTWLQPITEINPVKHFAIIARGILLKGSGVDVLYPQLLALIVIALVMVSLSAWRFRKQLG
jgi:ABC-2 type transport system ATP-binding protein